MPCKKDSSKTKLKSFFFLFSCISSIKSLLISFISIAIYFFSISQYLEMRKETFSLQSTVFSFLIFDLKEFNFRLKTNFLFQIFHFIHEIKRNSLKNKNDLTK